MPPAKSKRAAGANGKPTDATSTNTLEDQLATLFDEAQKPFANQQHLQAQFTKLERKNDAKQLESVFLSLLNRVLNVKKREPVVERIFRFVATVLILPRDPEQGEDEDDLRPIALNIFKYVQRLTNAKEKAVRQRACELLRELIKKSIEHAIESAAFDDMERVLMKRVEDKQPDIRAIALELLANFQVVDEECNGWEDAQNTITLIYMDMATKDPSEKVRLAALINMGISPVTLPVVVERTRDVKEAVRVKAYEMLGFGAKPEDLRVQGSNLHIQVVRDGLLDRSEDVRAACATMICEHWLPAESDATRFLMRFNVRDKENEAVCEQMLRAVFERLDGRDQLIRSLSSEDFSPESALYWRSLCAYYASRTDAEASDLFDEACSTLTELCDLAENRLQRAIEYLEDDREDDADDEEYIVRQILGIACLADLGDEAGRRRVSTLVRDLLTKLHYSDDLVPVAMTLLVKMHTDVNDRLAIVTEILSELGSDNFDQPANDDDDPELRYMRCLEIIELFLLKSGRLSVKHGCVMEMIERFILAGIPHGKGKIREQSLRCLGLCMLLDLEFARQYLSTVIAPLTVDIDGVKAISAKVLFDLLLVYGPAALGVRAVTEDNLDASTSSLSSEVDASGEAVHTFIPQLFLRLRQSEREVRNVVAEGFSKLLFNDIVRSPKIMAELLILYHNPIVARDEGSNATRQCLSVFFPAYAFASVEHQQCIEEAFMSVMNTIMDAPRASPLSRIDRQQAATFMIYLTRASEREKFAAQPSQECVHASLAVRVCNEIMKDQDNVTDTRMWCKLLAQLEPSPADQEAIKALRMLVATIIANLGDATAGKSLKKFQGQLADLDESPDDMYTPDQLEGLRHTVLRHLDADLAEFGATNVLKANRAIRKVNRGRYIDDSEESDGDSRPARSAPIHDTPSRRSQRAAALKVQATPARFKEISEEDEDEESDASDGDGDVYVVEAIRDHKADENGNVLLLVKWKNYDEGDNTWEPEDELREVAAYKAYVSKNGPLTASGPARGQARAIVA